MKILIHIYGCGETTPQYLGYIDYPKDVFTESDAQDCWEICNWTAWTQEKPENLHADIGSCSHGVCFTVGNSDDKWLAKSVGWLNGNSVEISEYVRQHKDKLLWI